MSPIGFRLPWRRQALPLALAAQLDPEEHIQAMAPCAGGKLLAASRFGLWVVEDGQAARLGWESIAKARLTAQVLSIIPTEVVGEFDDGVQVLRDQPTQEFVLTERSTLTDVVHTRVRRSVAASRHLTYPASGGWVVLRRVPGRNGLLRQVRLDPGTDPGAPGFDRAVAEVADDLEAAPQG
jgi:hypothetical protein